MARCSAPSLDGAFCGGDRESATRRRGSAALNSWEPGTKGYRRDGDVEGAAPRRLLDWIYGADALGGGKRGGGAKCHVIKKFAQPSATFMVQRPVVYGANDKGAEAIAPGTADLLLELHDPPRPSYLALPERLAREHNDFPRIVAVGSDRLLFMATQGRRDHGYFLCDVKARTAARLPVVPLEMGLSSCSAAT
ncbi:uncharacterized protein C2845_PM08G04970 [Panicum miliaceum]|uniref:Uncharacterized protein n=1 Tax=Panicum miliaceum TaxID=4540 RepID=A0A3L6R4Q0_PANMI|nr:uncharacterized protein C2845_PM08G04970 [Panicum miliaceum]